MWSFLGGLALLAVGYLLYGSFVERVIAPDGRPTPAVQNPDGVDFVELPKWKNMLIQLLNIAGIGPVIGVIMGIKFGEIVFFVIPVGNIIGGAVHDFLGGMMSIRRNGANLPVVIADNLGKRYAHVFSVFMAILLLLVVAVFINVPANLATGFFSGYSMTTVFWTAVAVIFLYYIAATMFPVDKIIGRIYPLFGVLLLVGTGAIFFSLCFEGFQTPGLLEESAAFRENMWTAAKDKPVIPLLFVTIACGIISGFHATQSPIVARTMKSEREARGTFYGMMILEGLIAMIWAAAGMAIYNLNPVLMSAKDTFVLNQITSHFLGQWMGGVTVVAVIILAITSGDTAMRSLRLTLAEVLHYDQKKLSSRFLLCLPLILIIAALLFWSNLSKESFQHLWNYFAWGNQVLAASTLYAAAVWLKRQNKCWQIAAIPGMFMAFIVFCYILWISPAHKGPWGFGMPLQNAIYFAAVLSVLLMAYVLYQPETKENGK